MRIAFVNPPVTREERYGSLAAAGSYAPPLALCSLAAVTRRAGYDTIIVDAPVEGLNHEQTSRRIEDHKADMVGITSVTSTFRSAARLAQMIKESSPGTTVVAGGVHVSALTEKVLTETQGIDVAVIGEGEETILELLAFLKSKQPLEKVSGIAFRNGGGVVETASRPLIRDLDTLPFPAWDMLPNFPSAYNVQAQSVAHSPSTSVCSSRGCTGRCTFCDRRIFGRDLRANSVGYVISMIKQLRDQFGIRCIQFEDDNLMVFRKRLFEFCDEMQKNKINMTWSCQARVDMVMPDSLQRMKEAGCWMILYGVESGSQRILDLMGKGITIPKIERAIELTHRAGIECKGFFITGFLGEDEQSLRETYQFVKRCKLDDISNHYYCPFPGSEAFARAPEYGKIVGDYMDMTYYRPVFIPEGLTAEDLIRHTKACYRSFYMRPRVILSYLKRARSFSDFAIYAKGAAALLRHIVSKRG